MSQQLPQGYPPPKPGMSAGKAILIIFGVVMVLGIGSCLVCAGAAHNAVKEAEKTSPVAPTVANPASNTAAAPAAPAAVAPAAQASKIGDTIKFDDSEWSVIEAKDKGKTLKSNNQFEENAKSDGKFVLVHFKVKNTTNKEDRIMDGPKVVDSQGREFKNYDNEAFFIPNNTKTLGLEALPSSISKDFWAVYEVAPDSKGMSFEARALSAMGDKKLVALGF
jgi:hypothetical protein